MSHEEYYAIKLFRNDNG